MKPTLQSSYSSKKISLKTTSDDKVRQDEEKTINKNKYLDDKTIKYFSENKFLNIKTEEKNKVEASYTPYFDCSYFLQYDICKKIEIDSEVCPISASSQAGPDLSKNAFKYYLPLLNPESLCKNATTEGSDITSYSTNIYMPGSIFPVTFTIAGEFNSTHFSKENWDEVFHHIPSYPTTTTTKPTTTVFTTQTASTTPIPIPIPIPNNGTMPNPSFFTTIGGKITYTGIAFVSLIIIYCNRKTIFHCRKSNEDILKENILNSFHNLKEIEDRIQENNKKNTANLSKSFLHSDEKKHIKKAEKKIEKLIHTALSKNLGKSLIKENTSSLLELYSSICDSIDYRDNKLEQWNLLLQ